MKKRVLAALLATTMVGTMLTGCGAGDTAAAGSSDSASSEAAADGDVSITIFNSKSEVQDQFVEMAEEYSEKTGVNVEIYYSSDTVAAHLATKYAANDPYTIAMVDPKDVYALAEEYAADLSGEKWIDNTDYEIEIGGKVVGFPTCIEARGIMYNADAIKNITGKDFDPTAYATLDDFNALLDELRAGGMENPTGIMKEDWSLAAHFLAEVYEQHEDPEAFMQTLYEGSADLMKDAKFGSLFDTFDTLKANNYAVSSPIAAEREVSEQKLAEGEIAFMFGGNWDWSMINAYDYSENMGMMPVPQNTDDGTNAKLVGGASKYLFIDGTDNTSDAQRQAAKDFLNWLVFEADGNSFLTEKCALVPAFNNIDASSLDPLSLSVKSYADKGALVPNYNYLPDDHISLAGAIMQEYLADQIDREGLATKLQDYFKGATAIEH